MFSMAEKSKRVAVIGAGVTGLAAIKCSLDEGLQPTCFERFDSIGGMWTYRDTVDGDRAASVYKSTFTNTSKEGSAFSDFLFPKEWPNFLHHSYMSRYLNMYAEEFGLKTYIRLSTRVTCLKQSDDNDTSGRWVVTTKNKNDVETSQEFDAVMVCIGLFNSPHLPDFPGLDEFQGEILHTSEYRTPKEFEDKRVVVVGVGNSAGDVATEAGRVASQVFLSARRGAWMISHTSHYGYPLDLALFRRRFLLPKNMVFMLFEKSLMKRPDMALQLLVPSFGFMQCSPLFSEDLPGCIMNGSVIVKGNLARFTKTGVEFEDGSSEDNIDFVIFGTGYRFKLPFETDCPALQVKDGRVPMYKLVFPLGLKHNTLSINGAVRLLGSVAPIVELQARWAARVFKGLAKLPSQPEMEVEVKMTDDEMAMMFLHNQRFVIPLQYMDNIASEVGVKPNFLKLFFTDPVLTFRCVFGPVLPYQYRLVGPGQWDGASEAVATVWDRVLEPLKTRSVPSSQTNKSYKNFIILVGIVLLAVVVALLTI